MENNRERKKKNAVIKTDSVSRIKKNSKPIQKQKSHRIPQEETKR